MASAYYSRNQSYSRSFNAEAAEQDGRYPRLRAAKALGLSPAAFDAGCKAIGYVATEWHHVGKYANEVYYYDTVELSAEPAFWVAAAATYKSARKRSEVAAMPDRIATDERQAMIADFRKMLKANGNCERPVVRHNSLWKWQARCAAAGISSTLVNVGDVAGFNAAVAAKEAKEAARLAKLAAVETTRDELRRYCQSHLTLRTDGCYTGCNICVKFLACKGSQVNVYGRGVNLTAAEAMRHVVAAVEACRNA